MSGSIPCIIFIYGPAGSGKTTFTWKFWEWSKENSEFNIAPVNFDPATINLPLNLYLIYETMLLQANLWRSLV